MKKRTEMNLSFFKTFEGKTPAMLNFNFVLPSFRLLLFRQHGQLHFNTFGTFPFAMLNFC